MIYPAGVSLTASQQKAFNALMRGENVFLTGGAGSGKTFLIQEFIKAVDPELKKTILLAPTGRAAINMGVETDSGIVVGSTLHKFFHWKNGVVPNYKRQVIKELLNADRIIIDEVSMVRIDAFDYFCDAVQDANNDREFWDDKPLQIIVVGDFQQLPPVISEKTVDSDDESDSEILAKKYGGDVEEGYAFESNGWEFLDIKTYELTGSVRQENDQNFVRALNEIRIGDPKGIGIKIINSGCSAMTREDMSRRITLCGLNKTVTKINEMQRPHAGTEQRCYVMDVTAMNGVSDYVVSNVKKAIPFEESITLWVGARVMCIVNDSQIKNGEMGIVTSMSHDGVMVKWDRGINTFVRSREVTFSKQKAKEKEDGTIEITQEQICEISQIPLKIAYAVTVHKAQGMTFEEMNLIPEFFADNHVYVALSRCKSLGSIHIYGGGIKRKDIKCNKKAAEFYRRLHNNEVS